MRNVTSGFVSSCRNREFIQSLILKGRWKYPLPFGLKKDGNRKVGAISELFFYSCLMRDALGGDFKFEERPSKPNCAGSIGDIWRCSSICAVLLAPATHPLDRKPENHIGWAHRFNIDSAKRLLPRLF
jgi:hypothetical protein